VAIGKCCEALERQRGLKLSLLTAVKTSPEISDVNIGIQGSFCCGTGSNITRGITAAIFTPVLPDNRVHWQKEFLERPMRG